MHGSSPIGVPEPVLESDQVIWLGETRSRDPSVVGAKAANLARARAAGMPTLSGFVLPTSVTDRWRTPVGRSLGEALRRSPVVRAAWEELSGAGGRPLVVRSSSVVEDADDSSMAGRFTSVLEVEGWDRFVEAVGDVVASAEDVDQATADEAGMEAGMAVLVQPFVEARFGGVLFGMDPLTGARNRLLAAVGASADDIVSGREAGGTASLTRRGRLVGAEGDLPAGFGSTHRRGLARLAATSERCFGGPQDVEWLVDLRDELVLLQSRPITASAVPAPDSRLLGPGPVAETFPDPLSRLERDLWLEPLHEGIDEALDISGAVRSRLLGRQGPPSVVVVGGRPAVDLELLGAGPARRGLWRLLDPRPGYRRMRAAWRLGRLRGGLPAIANDLVAEMDEDLREVPPLGELEDHDLVSVLTTTRQALVALHAHEVLAGLLLDPEELADARPTGASVALVELARGRLDGLTDDEILCRSPAVMALVPPRIGVPAELRAAIGRLQTTARPQRPPREATDTDAAGLVVARESLRMRIRWVHELQARTAVELGRRLSRRGQLTLDVRIDLLRRRDDMSEVVAAAVAAVRQVRLDELVAAVDDPSRVLDPGPTDEEVAPLPAAFRLTPTGAVVPEPSGGEGAQGVSAGRITAPITHDPAHAAGHVLVVPSLAPSLAPVLGSVAAVVAETGSPLSHLALLAREQAVPVVVGMAGAGTHLVDGEVVLVDGSTGEVGPP